MTAWREAKALDQLLKEYDACFPGRDKSSDGTIGDAAHQTRDSDHNPWITDKPGPNVVSAMDLTRDSAPGIPDTAQFLVDVLVERKDPRVKYAIHNGRIWRSYAKGSLKAWQPGPYTGANAHQHHVHVSVQPEKQLYDSTKSWGLKAALARAKAPAATRFTLLRGDISRAIARAQDAAAHNTGARQKTARATAAQLHALLDQLPRR